MATARARGLEVVGDVELFARFLAEQGGAQGGAQGGTRVIAITGTNGKSTVTALAGAMCRAAAVDCEVAGNISPAVLAALGARLDAGRLPEAWVVELSSFQLETTASLHPSAATVLNVSPDHLDRYPDVAAYAAAKARIFAGGGVQVLNRDDPATMGMRLAGQRVVTFGLNPAPDHDDFGLLRVFGELWLAMGATPLMPVRDMQLAGLHNAANALAALALCRAIGLPLAPLLDALRNFAGLPHRVERVGEIGGVTFYDDSKGTNVGSTVAALAGFGRQLNGSGGKVVLIAGGDGKQQDFAPLAGAVAGAARAVVLIGRDAPAIERALAVHRDADRARREHAGRGRARLRGGAGRRRRTAVARVRELRHVRQLPPARRGVRRRGEGAPACWRVLTSRAARRRCPSTTRASSGPRRRSSPSVW